MGGRHLEAVRRLGDEGLEQLLELLGGTREILGQGDAHALHGKDQPQLLFTWWQEGNIEGEPPSQACEREKMNILSATTIGYRVWI
jgi:hypothetical protein